jgi:alpha-beta hydrolase superfamily lysophospholipase
MMYNYEVEYIKTGIGKLALHRWQPDSPKAMVFYIHGKQSHAGWLLETAPSLAKQGIVVFALDRRGSGLSDGERGDVISLDHLLEDYHQVLTQIRAEYTHIPLTLFGQSFGGSILAGLLCWDKFDVNYDASVFCASGLGSLQHHMQQLKQKGEVFNPNIKRYELNLSDRHYTSDTKYLTFMRDDPLCIRSISGRTQQAFIDLEDKYVNNRVKHPDKPTIYIHPRHDPLVDHQVALGSFMRLTDKNGMVMQFNTDKHYLEFSSQRQRVWHWLSHYIVTAGYQQHA